MRLPTRARTRSQQAIAALLAASLLAACGGGAVKDGAPKSGSSRSGSPANAIPGPEPLSRYGNGPDYVVLGKKYRVMESSSGYRERGVASWYGTKFHGRLTSNREVYDMYAMTAAHKTLPLPTWVEVRNLRNNRTIIVRVNDRGPFVHNRVIDLSYGAAMALDMVDDGTSLVEIRALDFGEPAGNRTVRTVSTPEPAPSKPAATPPGGNDIYVQVGAFGDRSNAERRLAYLRQHDLGNVQIVASRSVASGQAEIYRVQLGPVDDVFEYDRIVDELAGLGIDDSHLVTR